MNWNNDTVPGENTSSNPGTNQEKHFMSLTNFLPAIKDFRYQGRPKMGFTR